MKYRLLSDMPVLAHSSGKHCNRSASTGVKIRSFPVCSSGIICVHLDVEPSLVNIVLDGSDNESYGDIAPSV